MFAGSGTNTPTLQAILDALGSQDAAVGYSVAYPFGVAGPILCMYAYLAFSSRPSRTTRSAAAARRGARPQRLAAGRPFAEFQQQLPQGVHVVAMRRGDQNQVPDPSTTSGSTMC
jgi:putative transport protein